MSVTASPVESLFEMVEERLSPAEMVNLAMLIMKRVKKEVGGGKRKSAKKEAESGSDSEDKPKREPSEKQKAWRDFVTRVREAVAKEDFKYKEAMQVAGLLKDEGKQESATDADIQEAYSTWKENPPALSKAAAKKAGKSEEAPKPAEEAPKKVVAAKAEEAPKPAPAKKVPKKSAPSSTTTLVEGDKTIMVHNGVRYEVTEFYCWREDNGKYAGLYNPKADKIDATVPEPELE